MNIEEEGEERNIKPQLLKYIHSYIKKSRFIITHEKKFTFLFLFYFTLN